MNYLGFSSTILKLQQVAPTTNNRHKNNVRYVLGGTPMTRPKKELESTTNPSVHRKRYKEVLSNKTGKCDRCPWHGVENSRQPKRTAKPKTKDHQADKPTTHMETIESEAWERFRGPLHRDEEEAASGPILNHE